MSDLALKSDAETLIDTLTLQDTVNAKLVPATKLIVGAAGVDGGFVSSANPLPISVATIPSHAVTDGGGSLTVDAPVATPVFVRLSDGAAAISTLPVSLASVPSHAVTNAGTFVVQVDGTALTRLTDIETNTDSLAVVGNGTAAAAQRVTIASDSTGVIAVTQSGAWSFTDGGGSITVDGTVSVSGVVPGTSATSLGKAEDAAAASGDTGVMALAVRKDTAPATTVGADGDYHPMLVDGDGRLWVSAKLDTALPAGTNAIGKLASNSGVTIGAVELAAAQTLATVTTVSTVTAVSDAQVQGKAAADAPVSGNPILVGARASAAVPTAMSGDGDAVSLWTDLSGRQIVREQCGTGTTTQVADTGTSATLLSANTSRKGCSIQNTSSAVLYLKCGATATATDFTVRLVQYAYWEAPYGYTGRIDGIWASDPGDGAAAITEFT